MRLSSFLTSTVGTRIIISYLQLWVTKLAQLWKVACNLARVLDLGLRIRAQAVIWTSSLRLSRKTNLSVKVKILKLKETIIAKDHQLLVTLIRTSTGSIKMCQMFDRFSSRWKLIHTVCKILFSRGNLLNPSLVKFKIFQINRTWTRHYRRALLTSSTICRTLKEGWVTGSISLAHKLWALAWWAPITTTTSKKEWINPNAKPLCHKWKAISSWTPKKLRSRKIM